MIRYLSTVCVVLAMCGCLFSCSDRKGKWNCGVYEGAWRDGRPEGFGRWTADKGCRIYEGMWHEGRLHGYGQLWCGDTLLRGFFTKGYLGGDGMARYPDGTCYRGQWRRGMRSGYGELTDTLGRIYAGIWCADTLGRGTRRDIVGCYDGDFNAKLEPHGEGVYVSDGGTYYDGEWREGVREGFGFEVGVGEVVKCGVWKGDGFRGEQMLYTSHRVYGIDISKYQHVSGRKRYGIDWSRLRITHLGHISTKKVEGVVDYPVSFVYIKATEGGTVLNPYYAIDLRAARCHGYPVGAYHFFSTKPADKQAVFFLKKAALRRGDLPPMLDMELSEAQIRVMGGIQSVFREMLVWLRMVADRTGTKPLVYISQNYVNKYWSEAPVELQEYPVWVARYGDYKPYVHLLYWQLSPDGTVRGIRNRVDIDVFNGSAEHFRDYVRECGVK